MPILLLEMNVPRRMGPYSFLIPRYNATIKKKAHIETHEYTFRVGIIATYEALKTPLRAPKAHYTSVDNNSDYKTRADST